MQTFIILGLLINLIISFFIIWILKSDINQTNSYIDSVVGWLRNDLNSVSSSNRRTSSDISKQKDLFEALIKHLGLEIFHRGKEDSYKVIIRKIVK